MLRVLKVFLICYFIIGFPFLLYTTAFQETRTHPISGPIFQNAARHVELWTPKQTNATHHITNWSDFNEREYDSLSVHVWENFLIFSGVYGGERWEHMYPVGTFVERVCRLYRADTVLVVELCPSFGSTVFYSLYITIGLAMMWLLLRLAVALIRFIARLGVK